MPHEPVAHSLEPRPDGHAARLTSSSDCIARQITMEATPVSVREALRSLMTAILDHGAAPDDVSAVELVLAEILNNIVEHAYQDSGNGDIHLHMHGAEETFTFRVSDQGLAMPNEELPSGAPACLDCATEDLPEGGFGWFLIRELTNDLVYSRGGDWNELFFTMKVAQA